jgi:hypothetical protein
LGNITIRFDGDFSELTVDAESGRFRGVGRATLYVADVPAFETFLSNLDRYPLERCSLHLAGTGRVILTAYQPDAVGHLYLQAELAEHDSPGADFVRIRVQLDYVRLSRLRDQLTLMRRGDLEQISISDSGL